MTFPSILMPSEIGEPPLSSLCWNRRKSSIFGWNTSGRKCVVEGWFGSTLLRKGRDVLVHCKGGLGRAGTIAARLLIELGMEPATAIDRVRAVRPGAIETPEQKQYVLGIRISV